MQYALGEGNQTVENLSNSINDNLKDSDKTTENNNILPYPFLVQTPHNNAYNKKANWILARPCHTPTIITNAIMNK